MHTSHVEHQLLSLTSGLLQPLPQFLSNWPQLAATSAPVTAMMIASCVEGIMVNGEPLPRSLVSRS